MVLELKLSKTDEGKFGFRLVGGADFEIPLTVSLVIEGGIAYDAGLREGDVVIRINKYGVTSLTHEEAHKVLSKAGNEVTLAVLRGDDITPLGPSPAPTCSSPVEHADEFRFDPAFQRDTSIISDQEIAEVISGEAEVLKEHNVIGVDFRNKMIPQSGVFKNSEVFQTLQEEKRKTKEDIEAEQKRWTTFLQKPNRPIPQPKIKEEVKKSTYKPPIIKQSKPLVDPEIQEKLRSVSPSPFCGTAHIPLAHATASPEPKYPEEKPVEQTDETINENQEEQAENIESNGDVEETCQAENVEAVEPESVSQEQTTTESARKEEPYLAGKTPEEQAELLKQLSQVQRQIEALQALPSTIQATLDALASQLTQLLQPPKQPTPPVEVTPQEETAQPTETEEEEIIIEEVQPSSEDEEVVIPEDPKAIHLGPKTEEEAEEIQHEFEEHEEDWQRKSEKPEPQRAPNDRGAWNIKSARIDFERNDEIRRTGDVKADLQAELKQALKKKPEKRKLKSAFGPLTPMERPIFLKGRIWKSPKDAYNEDFIAETISSQAELITGSTLGPNYESPMLGYDTRVNFLKYQKPEKDLSFLKNSETFKLLHGLDGREPAGIENRPEKVAAADDIERAITPCP